MSAKYKQKYNNLKRRVKNYLLENSSISDEVCYLQAELAAARDERMYLIERLMCHEGLDKSVAVQSYLTNEGSEFAEIERDGYSSPLKKKNRANSRNTSIVHRKGDSRFPINVNNVLIHCLGEIIPVNPNFHTAHWIYPVGYVATRIYAHPKDPRKKCVFTCKILNNAGIPQFQIIPDNDLDSVFFGETANMCHQSLIKTIQRSLKDSIIISSNMQGESFFGLSNPRVQTLLKQDVGYKQCAYFEGFLPNNEQQAICKDRDVALCFESLQALIHNTQKT